MPTSAQVPGGVVTSLQGRANVIPSGRADARPLQEGDAIQPGDVILAQADARLQVTDADGQAWMPRDMQLALADANNKAGGSKKHVHDKADHVDDHTAVDDAINAVDRGDDDAAAAAGLTGGGGGAMSLGLRVDRVIETVSPQEFAYSTPDREAGTPLTTVANVVNATATAAPTPPVEEPVDTPNHKPEAGNYSATTEEDKAVSGQVKATDADGDALTYTKGSDPAHGTVIVNQDGTWTYTPAKDYNGPDAFTVTVSDGKGGTATSTVEIGVTPVNDPPKVYDPASENFDPVTGHYVVTTDEDKAVSGQVKAIDVDGDTLTYAKGSDPAHGIVVVNQDGTWTYTPAKDYNGADTFTVSVSDGHGGTTTATIDIGINPVNDPPKIYDPASENFDPVTGHYVVTTDEDKAVSGQVKATDVDGDTLTYAKGSDPAHGIVVVNQDGTWTYTPAKDYNGADTFTVSVSDGHGGTTVATIDIGINPVNDPPKVYDPASENFDPVTGHYVVTTDEDKAVSGQVKATDVDGDTLTYAKGSDPAHGIVVVNQDGTWTYTPAKDYNGADTFTVSVSDGHGGTTVATIDIGIAPAATNHAPVVSAESDGHNILGLVDLAVNPLLDLSKTQHVAVADADNNLIRVDVSVGQFLSLGTLLGDHSKLSLALDPALTQGLHISGNDSRHLVIESDTPGHTIDATQVNHLLSTLSYDPAHVLGLSVDLFPQLTIKATDAAGATDSKTVSSSVVAIDVNAPPLADATSHVEHTAAGSAEHQATGDTDVFSWTLADRPAQGEHNHIDTITDFNCAARSFGGDVLDLRDLLQTDHHATTAGTGTGTASVDKLLNFLDFDTHSQPGSTIIHVSASGSFQADATGHSDSAGCADQQHIVLANVDLRASLGLDQSANDHQIISELMNRGKLLVDHS